MDRIPVISKSPDTDDLKSEEELLLIEGKEHKRYNNETILGLIFVFLSVLLTALSKICVQALKAEVPHFFLNTLRCSTANIGIVIVLLYKRHIFWVGYMNIKPTALYSVSAALYGLSVYIPVVYIPLITTEACTNTTALLSSLIIFGLIKKEDIRIDQVRLLPLLLYTILFMYREKNIGRRPWSLSIKNTPALFLLL